MANDLRVIIGLTVNENDARRSLNQAIKRLESKINKLNLKLNIDTSAIAKKIKDLEINLQNISASTNNQNANDKAGDAAIKSASAIETMKKAMQPFTSWMPEAVSANLQGIVATLIEVDSQMTQLKKVMNEDTNFDEMLNGNIEISNELGRSIKEVHNVILEFARMGYDVRQTLSLTKTAALLQNISELTPGGAVKTLTAAMNDFNVKAEDSVRVADSLSNVDNNFTVSSKDLSLSLIEAGSAANTYGVSMEKVIGDTTAIAAATNANGTSIGNSLSTIYSRIATLEQSREVLNSIGISMKSLDGDTKGTSAILDELAEKWSGLTSEQQQNVATQLAGQNQMQSFLALMNQYDVSTRASETAVTSQGSAMRENAEYMGSLEAKIQQMQTEWENLAITMGQSGQWQAIIDMNTSLVHVLAKLIDFFGLFNVAIFSSLSIMLNFSNAGKSMVKIFSSMSPHLNKLNNYVDRLSAAYTRASRSTQVMGVNLIKLKMQLIAARVAAIGLQTLLSLGLSLAITAVVSGLTYLYNKFQEQKKIQEELEKQNKIVADSWINHKDTIIKLVDEYNKLHELTNGGTVFADLEQEQKYTDLVERLSDLMPNLVDSIDDKGNKHLKNAEAIKEELKYAQMLADNEQKQQILDAQDNFKKDLKNVKKSKKDVDDIKSKIGLKGEYIPHEYGATFIEYSESTLNKLERQRIIAEQQLATHTNILRNDLNSLTRTILDQNNVELSDNLSKQFDEITNSLDIGELSAEQLEDKSYELSNFITELNKLNLIKSPEGIKKASDNIYALGQSIGIPNASIKNLIESIEKASKSASDFYKDSKGYKYDPSPNLYNFSEATKKLGESFSSAKDEIVPLNQLLSDIDKGQSQNASSMTDLIQKYPELSNHLKKTKDGYTFEREAVIKLKNSKIELFKISINDEKQRAIDLMNNSVKNLKSYGLELKAIGNLADAKKNLSKIEEEMNSTESELNSSKQFDKLLFAGLGKFRQPLEEEGSGFTQFLKNKLSALQPEFDALKENISEFEELEKLANSYLTGITDYGLGVDKNNNERLAETNELLTEQQKRLKEIEEALSNLQSKRSRIKKGSEEYRKSLLEEIKLLKEQKKIYEEGVKTPSTLISTNAATTSKKSFTASPNSNGAGNKISNMLSAAQDLQGGFKYGKIGGEFKGTYEQFVTEAVSDCSQFVQEMFKEFLGIKLPRTAAEQAKQGTAVDKKDLKPGDLIFFKTTNKDNSHVGIYMGDNKFIQMGEELGLKTANLNSSYWAPKYQGARRIVDDSDVTYVTPSTSKNKTEVLSQSELETTDDDKKKVADLDAQIYASYLLVIDDTVTESENRISDFENKISLSQGKQSRLSPTSAEWRKEEQVQISLLEQKQKEIEAQNKQLNKMVAEYKITSGEYDQTKAENSTKWWDVDQQIKEKNFTIVQSTLDEYAAVVEKVGSEIDFSSAKLSLLTEGSAAYNQELEKQIPLLKQQQAIHQSVINTLNEQIQSDKLTADQKTELITKLNQEIQAWMDNEAAIKSNMEQTKQLREAAADNIINELKKAIESERDLKLDAINQERKEEEERHQERTKNIDDEYKQFEEYINAQIKAFDRQASDEDYTKELNQKLEERQKIIDEINKWSMDTSMQGKAKTKELQEQLDTKNEEIDEFKLNRERELRKQGLQDQLDDRKKYADKNKEMEDELSDSIKDNLDDQQTAIEQEYNSRLENEKKFYDLKQRLLSQDSTVVKAAINEIQTEYGNYFTTLQGHAFTTNQAFENLNYTLQKSLENLQKYANGDYSKSPDDQSGYTPSLPSGGPNNGDQPGQTPDPQKEAAWKTYLSNKQRAETIRLQMAQSKNNKAQYARLESIFASLSEENQALRKQYGFPDGSYATLKDLKVYHDGGEVGVEGTTTGKWWSKFLKSDEVPSILKKGEVILNDPVDFINTVVSKISNGISNFTLNHMVPSPASAGGNNSNSTIIQQVVIQANDKETATGLLDKFQIALNKANKKGFFKSGT
ncbi:phage tail tape measure protein [Paenibacillus oralis]|uniref:Phage tail tape measure protein n=1 Tax=Paenibacillus oralis TaxID=2490856 RepID=A0A3P3U7S2_9BACL|nr:phage tail tape measure protein [Paenibacillus oralis]RRJ66401.1 phage tail tape measure protein [Paenibacillus oralis]